MRAWPAWRPCEPVIWVSRMLQLLRIVDRYDAAAACRAFSPRSAISHRLDVRRFAPQKRAALAAHVSQVRKKGRSGRLFWVLIRMPAPVFGLLLGREWFTEPDCAPGSGRSRHIL